MARPVAGAAAATDPATVDLMDPATLPAWQVAKRSGIVEAASGLLKQRSFDAIHIREVAETAGVALATVYRYFRSKEQVYAAVIDSWSSWDLAPPPVAGTTPTDRLRERVLLLINAVERRPHFFLAHTALQHSTDAHVRGAVQRWTDGGAAWLVADIDDLRLDPQDAQRYAFMLWAIISDVLKKATLHDGTFDEARATVSAFIDLLERLPGADR